MYQIKEIFLTLQGEGAQAGRKAVFCRFAGCNLWSGREQDRASAICDFCDTDFVGTDGENGAKYTSSNQLVDTIARVWQGDADNRFVVLTGGEPMLQVDDQLIHELHQQGFKIAIETNGTLPVPSSIDWICVSPKAGSELVQTTGDELKLVYPQPGFEPQEFADLPFKHHYIQPMDGPNLAENTARAVAYCKQRPSWRLSLQTHKLIGIA